MSPRGSQLESVSQVTLGIHGSLLRRDPVPVLVTIEAFRKILRVRLESDPVRSSAWPAKHQERRRGIHRAIPDIGNLSSRKQVKPDMLMSASRHVKCANKRLRTRVTSVIEVEVLFGQGEGGGEAVEIPSLQEIQDARHVFGLRPHDEGPAGRQPHGRADMALAHAVQTLEGEGQPAFGDARLQRVRQLAAAPRAAGRQDGTRAEIHADVDCIGHAFRLVGHGPPNQAGNGPAGKRGMRRPVSRRAA
jgi:hypothetical protein